MINNVREVLGEIRYRLSNRLKELYPDMYGARGFMQTTEPYLVTSMSNVNMQGRQADYYIVPGDGAGPIAVEIGDKSVDEWESLLSTDGIPVRVLRVALDGTARLSRARDTNFERDLLSVLA